MAKAKTATKGPVPPKASVPRRMEFWIGTLAKCPFQNLTVAGQTFHRYTEKVEHPDGSLRTKRTPRNGAVVALDEAQVKLLRERIDASVIRPNGRNPILINRDAETFNPMRAYQPREGDTPLGEFIYMVPVDEAATVTNNHQWWESEPPSYADLAQ